MTKLFAFDIYFISVFHSIGHLMCRAQSHHGPQMMGLRLVRPNSQRVWSLRQEGINPQCVYVHLDDIGFGIRTDTFLFGSHRLREFKKRWCPPQSQKIHTLSKGKATKWIQVRAFPIQRSWHVLRIDIYIFLFVLLVIIEIEKCLSRDCQIACRLAQAQTQKFLINVHRRAKSSNNKHQKNSYKPVAIFKFY